MPYLVYETKDDAEQRSRQAWEDVLGRTKRPEDVTEFLWPVVETVDGFAVDTAPVENVGMDAATQAGLVSDIEQSAAISEVVLKTPPPLEEM